MAAVLHIGLPLRDRIALDKTLPVCPAEARQHDSPFLPRSAMSKMFELCATVSSKGQVVIPAVVRKRLGLVQGSVLRFVLDADSVRLLPAAGDVRRLKGRLPRPAAGVSVDDMNRAVAERRVRIAPAPTRRTD